MLEKVKSYFGNSTNLNTGKAEGLTVLGLRFMMGWIFFTSGLSKYMENGLAFDYASVYLSEATPITTPELALSFPEILNIPGLLLVKAGAFIVEPLMSFMSTIPFIGPLVVITQLLIGLALIFGVLSRLSALGGSFMMLLFYYGNAEWGHGLLNANFVYLAVFLAVAVLNAGKIYGLDNYLSEKLRTGSKVIDYLLGVE